MWCQSFGVTQRAKLWKKESSVKVVVVVSVTLKIALSPQCLLFREGKFSCCPLFLFLKFIWGRKECELWEGRNNCPGASSLTQVIWARDRMSPCSLICNQVCNEKHLSSSFEGENTWPSHLILHLLRWPGCKEIFFWDRVSPTVWPWLAWNLPCG